MTPNVQVGTILIEDRPLITRILDLGSESYSGNWSVVKAIDGLTLDRKIHASGWNFFFMAEEVKATVFGSLAAKSIQKALKRICLKVGKQDRTSIVSKSRKWLRTTFLVCHTSRFARTPVISNKDAC
jgi:hypothetical protein